MFLKHAASSPSVKNAKCFRFANFAHSKILNSKELKRGEAQANRNDTKFDQRLPLNCFNYLSELKIPDRALKRAEIA